MVGDDEYPGAVARYARAVDIADRARAEWVKGGRLIVARNPNGASGIHPLLKAMMMWESAAAGFSAELGLTPASAKRIGPQRGRGRPVGANSAPDRVALPGPLYAVRTGDGLPPVEMAREPATLKVNRARGHQED